MDNDLIRLTADYYNGTLDDAGARRLAALIASSPEAASSFKAELQRLGSASSDGEAVVLLNNSRSANRKKAIRRGIIGSAGAFAVLVVCLLVLLRPTSPEVEERTVAMIDKQDGEMLSSEVSGREYRIPEAERQEGFVYCAPADSKMTVSLSDGTEIVLNKGSKLLLDADFGKLDRNVSLDGEAFFKVAPDKEKVFRIACGNETFVVKGTSFNIMSYSEDKFSVVTLHTGSLAAHIKNDTIILDPGDELRVDEGEDNISRRKVDVRNSTRWMDGDVEAPRARDP